MRRLAYLAQLALVVLLGGCRGDRVDVFSPPDPITDCAEAVASGEPGHLCVELEPGCVADFGCCRVELFCELGRLIRLEDCAGCGECISDAECGALAWCVGEGECVACPPLSPDVPPCEPGLEHVYRNRCEFDACAPPSECVDDLDCGDPGSLRCAVGANCPCGDESCCVNRCAPIVCAEMEAPPEGCATPCADEPCPTDLCYTAGCVCRPTGWACEVRCALDAVPPRC